MERGSLCMQPTQCLTMTCKGCTASVARQDCVAKSLRVCRPNKGSIWHPHISVTIRNMESIIKSKVILSKILDKLCVSNFLCTTWKSILCQHGGNSLKWCKCNKKPTKNFLRRWNSYASTIIKVSTSSIDKLLVYYTFSLKKHIMNQFERKFVFYMCNMFYNLFSSHAKLFVTLFSYNKKCQWLTLFYFNPKYLLFVR